MSDKEQRNLRERIYLNFNYPGAVPGGKTLLTGIRGKNNYTSCRCVEKVLYITGFYTPPDDSKTISFLYVGDLTGNIDVPENQYYILNYPLSKATNLYGPYILKDGNVRIVGNYTTEEGGNRTFGCMYTGCPDRSFGKWLQLKPTLDTFNVIAHSTSGDLVVGNYDTVYDPLGKAFIYDVKKKVYHKIIKRTVKSITAYGVWHNSGSSYTICGGYSKLLPLSQSDDLSYGYIVDWNNNTNTLSNWREYQYDSASTITHFDGITSDGCSGYNLTGDSITDDEEIAFFAHVERDRCGHFTEADWSQVQYPGSEITSGNSVYEDIVIGVYTLPSDQDGTVNGYISMIA